MPKLNKKFDILKSMKEASSYQMDSAWDAILKGIPTQATSIMWDGFHKMMRVSGFYVIMSLGTFLQILEDQIALEDQYTQESQPDEISADHPDALELQEDLQRAFKIPYEFEHHGALSVHYGKGRMGKSGRSE
jgi:hypothetical protein